MDSGTEDVGPAQPVQQPRFSPSLSTPTPADAGSDHDDAQLQSNHSHSHTPTPTPTSISTHHAQTLADLQAEVDTEGQTQTQTQPERNRNQQTSPSPSPSSKSRPVSGVVPPWWQRHERNVSRASQSSLRNTITLEDHTADPDSETSRGLWARSVSIDDHRVVQGKTGVGAYVVWNCIVQTLDGGPIVVRMRYSEFDDLRNRLVSSFPHARSALPALPPKSVLFKFRPKFLENRRVGLEYFLNCVLLNPEFSSSPIVKDFLFGRMS